MTQDTRRVRSFVLELPEHESPLLIALREMVAEADGEGRLERDQLVEAFRASYVSHYDRLGADASDRRRLRRIRRLAAEEIDSYLQEQVLARLSAEGWLQTDGEGSGASGIRFEPGIWARIAEQRGALIDLIDSEIERRLERVVEPEPDARPPDGSRLVTERLVKIYKRRRVVDDVDLELRQGEIVGLLGPNGAGKTTTFYMIVGLVPPDAGRVFIDDQELTNVPMYKRARLGIGYLSQEPSVFRKLTVEQNVLAILETLPISDEERDNRLEELLDELSIKHLRDHKAYSLSGGERRRLEITRALVTRPKFMLLDEPFAGVDPIAVDDIQRIVAGLKQRGLGVLITDHNVRETLSITDRAYIMFDGRIHLEGTSEELVNDPQARRLYLGEDFRL